MRFKIGLLVTSGDPGAGEESERAAGVVRSGRIPGRPSEGRLRNCWFSKVAVREQESRPQATGVINS